MVGCAACLEGICGGSSKPASSAKDEADGTAALGSYADAYMSAPVEVPPEPEPVVEQKPPAVDLEKLNRDLYDECWNSDFNEVFDLLEKGADPSKAFGGNKVTSLHVAARTNYNPVLQILIKSGKVSLDARNGSGETPLHSAVKEGHVNATQTLVDAKADINARNSEGVTALGLAKAKNREDFVNFLQAYGAIE
mmetsp:Transcript_140879/g.262882  ORF Transcript_140879/g.262882 Transcript_140879/m.262882 type:complete len:194 (+) Transcript_140879:38-619(+)